MLHCLVVMFSLILVCQTFLAIGVCLVLPVVFKNQAIDRVKVFQLRQAVLA